MEDFVDLWEKVWTCKNVLESRRICQTLKSIDVANLGIYIFTKL